MGGGAFGGFSLHGLVRSFANVNQLIFARAVQELLTPVWRY